MKVGIYIPGIGQSFVSESVEKYAERLMNEMHYATVGKKYELKSEKIKYSNERYSNVVSIYETGESSKVVYKLYDFNYHALLTDKFNRQSIILKNIWLFFVVLRKFPQVIFRVFKPSSHNRSYQTLYMFGIFLLMAFAVLIMLPATIGAVGDLWNDPNGSGILGAVKNKITTRDIPFVSIRAIQEFSALILSLTSLLIVFVPNSKVLVLDLATEFVCVNGYIQDGAQKQFLQGNLELLVDHISEVEGDCKIHIHSYSYGSIIALDYIFPFGSRVTKNSEKMCEAIVTIGAPVEFLKSYYTQFYENRNMIMDDKITWLNIYSSTDVFASNFRNDLKIGEAQFGIKHSKTIPINLNYEVIPKIKNGFVGFFMLSGVKAHGMYWDQSTQGQSCLRLIHDEMVNRNYFN